MALVKFREVKKALDVCAPGYELRETDHRIRVLYNGLQGTLPSGGHGTNEFDVFWVRKCASSLEIYECMEREVNGLGRNLRSKTT